MRFIWTFIWSFLLVQMASYVIASMTEKAYDFQQASVFSLVVGVFVIAISTLIPNEPVAKHH